jgi:hypothetical protein
MNWYMAARSSSRWRPIHSISKKCYNFLGEAAQAHAGARKLRGNTDDQRARWQIRSRRDPCGMCPSRESGNPERLIRHA